MSYDVIVVPQVEMTFNGTECVQLMLSYNTLYTVSVEATQCGGNTTSTTVELNYSKSVIILLLLPGTYEPPKVAKERVTTA